MKKMTSITGGQYMMAESEEMELKSELSWKGRMIFEMIKEQQPERFKEMVQEKTLIPLLKKISHEWFLNMRQHQRNGLLKHEAEEIEWPELVAKAGL